MTQFERIEFPVPTETLWDILQNKAKFQDRYIVDAKKSIEHFTSGSMLGENTPSRKLANYINNLGLRIRLDTSGLNFADRVELFFDWLNGSNICFVQEFTETIIALTFMFKGFKTETFGIFDETEARVFMKEYHDDVENWIVFFDSLVVYALKQYHGHGLIDLDPSKEFATLDETGFTPLNLVNVFEYADFTTYYSILDGEHFAYLPREFDTPYFAGKQLYDYFYVKDNPVAAYLAVTLVDAEANNHTDQPKER